MKSTKAYVLGALIVTMSIVIIGVSMSYAYYVNTVEEVNPDKQGVNVGSGELKINFATTESINADAASLINDSEITTKANYTAFSIELPSDAIDKAAYNLYLTDIKMTSNFKSTYLKWALYDDNGIVGTPGNFNGVTLSNPVSGVYDASNIALLNNQEINKGTTKNYKLYIWLSNDPDNNQVSLLNGTLSAKVAFKAVSK